MTPPAKTEGGTSEASGASPGPWPSSWAPGLLQDVNRKHGEDSWGSCFKSTVWISSDMLTWTHPHPSEPCPLLKKLEKPNYFHHSLFSLGFSCSIIVSDVRHPRASAEESHADLPSSAPCTRQLSLGAAYEAYVNTEAILLGDKARGLTWQLLRLLRACNCAHAAI